MKKYILPLLTVLLPMVAFADAVEIDGIYYNLDLPMLLRLMASITTLCRQPKRPK